MPRGEGIVQMRRHEHFSAAPSLPPPKNKDVTAVSTEVIDDQRTGTLAVHFSVATGGRGEGGDCSFETKKLRQFAAAELHELHTEGIGLGLEGCKNHDVVQIRMRMVRILSLSLLSFSLSLSFFLHLAPFQLFRTKLMARSSFPQVFFCFSFNETAFLFWNAK